MSPPLHHPPWRFLFRQGLWRAVLMAAGLFAGLAEFGLHAFPVAPFHVLPAVAPPLLEFDDALLWKLKSDQPSTVVATTAIITNAHGLRESEPVNDTADVRILVLGDDFSFGWGVQERERFSERLEYLVRLLQPGRSVQVLNASQPMYGVDQQEVLLAGLMDVFKPQVVMQGLHPVHPLASTAHPLIQDDQGRLRVEHVWGSVRGAAATPTLGRACVGSPPLGSRLLGLLICTLWSSDAHPTSGHALSAPRQDWPVVSAILRQTGQRLHQQGVAWIPFAIPIADTTSPEGLDASTGLARAVAQAQGELIDLQTHFRPHAADVLTHPGTGYWTKIGHMLVATTLLPHLAQALKLEVDEARLSAILNQQAHALLPTTDDATLLEPPLWRMETASAPTPPMAPQTPATQIMSDSDGVMVVSDLSQYHYQAASTPITVSKGQTLRVVYDITTHEGQGALSILDVQANNFISTHPLMGGEDTGTIDFTARSDQVILLLTNHHLDQPRRARMTLHHLALHVRQGEPSLLESAQTLWGETAFERGGILQTPRQFPALARINTPGPSSTRWSLNLGVARPFLLHAPIVRREIEDIGLALAQGRVQLWWGDRRTGGARIYVDGVRVASNDAARLRGFWHRIGVEVDEPRLTMRLDGRAVLETTLVGPGDGQHQPILSGPIDLSSRNSPVFWHAATATGLAVGEAPPPLPPRPDDPIPWEEAEAPKGGVVPLKTHYWHRWLGRQTPSPMNLASWPDLHGVPTLVTHGPLLGMPKEGSIAVGVRTQAPTSLEIVAGVGDDPVVWPVIGHLVSTAAQGLWGHTDLREEDIPWSRETLNFTLRQGEHILDTREDGVWPQLRHRWFRLGEAESIQLAVSNCDNFAPAPESLWPSVFSNRIGELDLFLHLGDITYEQGYRQRLEVSRLDYLTSLAPGTNAARRARRLPMLALFDDHELFNDVTAVAQFGAFPVSVDPGIEKPQNLESRITSRDMGRRAWEEAVGWTTPGSSLVRTGRGGIRDGRLLLDAADVPSPAQVKSLASVILRPQPESGFAGGVYQVRPGRDDSKGLSLWPKPEDAHDVAYGFSAPRYAALILGPVELLLLDTRSARSMWRLDRMNPEATLLGKQQKEWLLERIRTSTAKVLLLASSGPFSFHNGYTNQKRDSWTGYGAERKEILAALRQRTGRAIILSGDLHGAAVRDLGDGLLEVVVGSWSNWGFCDILSSMDTLDGDPLNNEGLLYSSVGYRPACDWATHATLLGVNKAGEVKLEIIDLSANTTVYTETFVSP